MCKNPKKQEEFNLQSRKANVTYSSCLSRQELWAQAGQGAQAPHPHIQHGVILSSYQEKQRTEVWGRSEEERMNP